LGSKASGASACLCVIRGCMCLLSLAAPCLVCTVSLTAGQSIYNPFVADVLRLPLRCGFRARLMPSVAMTADVKGGASLVEVFLSVVFCLSGALVLEKPEPGRADG